MQIYQYNALAADSSIAFSRYYYAITLWSLLGLTDGKNVRIEIDYNSRWKLPTHHFAFKLHGKDGCGTFLWREILFGSVVAPKSWELKNIAINLNFKTLVSSKMKTSVSSMSLLYDAFHHCVRVIHPHKTFKTVISF